MKFFRSATLAGASALALTAILAACGTGGGGGTIPGGGGGGGGTPTPNPTGSGTPTPIPTGSGTPTPIPTGSATPTPVPTHSATPTPVPTQSPGLTGTLTIGGAPVPGGNVVFTCGCSSQAGIVTIAPGGSYVIGPSEPAIPSTPSPTYTTHPGRNYLIVGASSTQFAQAWTMQFLGNTPSHNLSLGATTDAPAAAASVYIFAESQNNSDASFDDWNFNTISAWTGHLRTGPLTAAETTLVTDVGNAQLANTSLFPTIPVWNPYRPLSPPANAKIAGDIAGVHSESLAHNNTAPTPCPLNGTQPACTGAPTP